MSTFDASTGTVILCGPPSVVKVVERECEPCGATTTQVEKFLGVWYGHDFHCLTCRRTDQEGFGDEPATGLDLATWDRYANDPVPTELFDAAVDAEIEATFQRPTGDAAVDKAREAELDRAWSETRAAVHAHWAAVVERKAGE